MYSLEQPSQGLVSTLWETSHKWKARHAMIAGAYDFIEACREDYGDAYVDALLDAGYEPKYIPGYGYKWVMKSVLQPVA